jgi:hypothetical protein
MVIEDAIQTRKARRSVMSIGSGLRGIAGGHRIIGESFSGIYN